jgi:hypothetical protein
LYSRSQPPSRPDTASASAPSRRNALLWTVGIILFFAGAVYAVGGASVVRQFLQVRRAATAALQPPSDAAMQRAVEAAARDSTRRAEAAADQPKPVSVAFIALSIGSIVAVVIGAFYVTGRAPRRDTHA